MASAVQYPHPKRGEHKSPANTHREYAVHEQMKFDRKVKADERAAKWQALTPKQQIAILDKRLGKGKGATKQRIRLAEKLRAE